MVLIRGSTTRKENKRTRYYPYYLSFLQCFAFHWEPGEKAQSSNSWLQSSVMRGRTLPLFRIQLARCEPLIQRQDGPIRGV